MYRNATGFGQKIKIFIEERPIDADKTNFDRLEEKINQWIDSSPKKQIVAQNSSMTQRDPPYPQSSVVALVIVIFYIET